MPFQLWGLNAFSHRQGTEDASTFDILATDGASVPSNEKSKHLLYHHCSQGAPLDYPTRSRRLLHPQGAPNRTHNVVTLLRKTQKKNWQISKQSDLNRARILKQHRVHMENACTLVQKLMRSRIMQQERVEEQHRISGSEITTSEKG